MTDLFKPQDPLQIDEDKDYLKELTAPGGKFDRSKYQSELEMYQAIAKGKFLADQMVDIKNQREDELRAEYTKVVNENKAKADLQELIDQMQQNRLTNSEQTQAKEDTQPIKLEDMESLFDQKYEARRLRERQEDNLNQVQNKLKTTWGDNYSRTLKQKTEELDLSEEDVLAMARSNPKLLYRTFGLDQQQGRDNLFNSPPRSQQRADSFAPSGPRKRTWSYYDDMKKTNPNLYFDRKIAVQMMKDLEEQGEAFYDGNYFIPGMHENK